MLQRLILNGDAVPERLRAYAEREWKRPSVAAYVAHPRPPALDGRLRRLRQIFSPS
jgi:glutathione S-transferase